MSSASSPFANELQVCVASKPPRGCGIPFPERPGYLRVDVTSGSAAKLPGGARAVELSPLHLGPVRDAEGNVFVRFENLWTYHKVYPQLGHWDPDKRRPTAEWRRWRAAGMQKLTGGKGVRTPPEVARLKKQAREGLRESWTPVGHWWGGRLLSYVEAREQIYVPLYAALIRDSAAVRGLRELGRVNHLMILDLDGPDREAHWKGVQLNAATWERHLRDT